MKYNYASVLVCTACSYSDGACACIISYLLMPVSLEVRCSVAAIVPPIEGGCTGGFPLLFTIDFKGFMKIICCQVSPSFGDRQSVFK